MSVKSSEQNREKLNAEIPPSASPIYIPQLNSIELCTVMLLQSHSDQFDGTFRCDAPHHLYDAFGFEAQPYDVYQAKHDRDIVRTAVDALVASLRLHDSH